MSTLVIHVPKYFAHLDGYKTFEDVFTAGVGDDFAIRILKPSDAMLTVAKGYTEVEYGDKATTPVEAAFQVRRPNGSVINGNAERIKGKGFMIGNKNKGGSKHARNFDGHRGLKKLATMIESG